LKICKRLDVDAIIPGYGFLSEDAPFAQQVVDAGMVFVGPSPESMTEMGQKHRARGLAFAAEVPVVPGTELLESETAALEAATKLGFPVCRAGISLDLADLVDHAESYWRRRRNGATGLPR
jgi:urea carboxylase